MVDSSESCETRQLIIFFDVGGVIFRVLRETIQNYPSSLLAKLVEEFPNLGYEDKPVFIDRSPMAFEWIREIYRNGDFESCIPDMSRAALERELDFYQLPDMSELGISHLDRDKYPIETVYNWCGGLLAEELTKRDLWKSLPLYVWFYKEVERKSDAFSAEKVLIAHECGCRNPFEVPKEQSGFSHAVRGLSLFPSAPCWVSAGYGGNQYQFLVRNVSNPEVYSMLQRALLEYGLSVKYDSGEPTGKGLLVKFEDAKDRATS